MANAMIGPARSASVYSVATERSEMDVYNALQAKRWAVNISVA